MWSNEQRKKHKPRGGRYPSDVSDEEWAIIEPMIPLARTGGRKRETDTREVFNAIRYIAMDRSDPFFDYFMVAAGRFDPFLADVHHALARVLQRRGKSTEAPMHYRMARKLDPTIEVDPMYLEIISDAE